MAETGNRSMKNSIPRICLLTETFYPVVGGGETHARLLARQLNSMGMETFVLTRRTDANLPSNDLVDNIITHRVPPAGTSRFGKYAMVPHVMKELRRRQAEYDIIFVCGFRVLGAPAVIMSQRLHKPCVLRAESIGEMSGGYASVYKKLPPVAGSIFRASVSIRNRILSKADAFVCISQPIEDEFITTGISSERIKSIANGLDTSLYKPVDATTQEILRKKLGIPAGKYVAAYSGKLNQGKGLECLLRAWNRIYQKRKDICLMLVGSGGGQTISCETELRRYVEDHGLQNTVLFTGYVENVNEYLQASDMFVFPSENEAFGLSLVEAMACGLPVIASRTGGIPEIVQNGKNGILIEPKDDGDLSNQIENILDDPYLAQSLASAGQQCVNDRFSIEAIATEYYDMFAALFRGQNDTEY